MEKEADFRSHLETQPVSGCGPWSTRMLGVESRRTGDVREVGNRCRARFKVGHHSISVLTSAFGVQHFTRPRTCISHASSFPSVLFIHSSQIGIHARLMEVYCCWKRDVAPVCVEVQFKCSESAERARLAEAGEMRTHLCNDESRTLTPRRTEATSVGPMSHTD